MSNEAGGKHYGKGLQPWDLQKDMQTWGSVFIDARRTDAMEYIFRTKGDRSKQLDDARKAKHNCEVIIAELEKQLAPKMIDATSYNDIEQKLVCPINPWPDDQIPSVSHTPETEAAWDESCPLKKLSDPEKKEFAREMERMRNHYRVKMYDLQTAVRNLKDLDKWGTVEQAHKHLFALLPENC